MQVHTTDEEEVQDPPGPEDGTQKEPGGSKNEKTRSDNTIPALADQHKKHTNGTHQSDFTPEERAQIDLIEMCTQAQCPIGFVDRINEWANKHSISGVDFTKQAATRKATIKMLHTRYNNQGGKPNETTVFLSESKQTIKIVVHDFLQQLYSLLTDPDLMKGENLCVKDPFAEPPPIKKNPKFEFWDVSDGGLWRQGWETYVQVDNDLFCPIVLFIDKTHIDAHGRLTLEPVTFTLGWFNKQTRKKRHAWRSLGYVPNLQNIKLSGTGSQKQQDYHTMLATIFKSLSEAQYSKGIEWEWTLGPGPPKKVQLKVPVIFVMGDTEGHDKLCGLKNNRSQPNVAGMCRYCKCPTHELSNVNDNGKRPPNHAQDIEKLY